MGGLLELVECHVVSLHLSFNFLNMTSENSFSGGNPCLQLLNNLISLLEKIVLLHQSLRL